MNKNTEYEVFTQEIYKHLLKTEGLETITVQHDVLIKGSHGQEYQIDVYWEFMTAGVLNRVAIECKNYKDKVRVGKIRDFFGVVEDVGNIRGVVVSKQGFQSGAVQYALDHGIQLVELRYPNKDEFYNTGDELKKISIGGTLFARQLINMEFIIDKDDFVLKHPDIKGQINFYYKGNAKDSYIYNSNGEKITSFNEIWMGINTEHQEAAKLEYKYDGDDIYTDTNNYGRLKIKALLYRYNVIAIKQSIVVDMYDFVKAIHKNINTGEHLIIYNHIGDIYAT
jgi:hypothetical protein